MKRLKILFLGTPKFASIVLSELINNDINVVAVITQPDKRTGRRHRLEFPITKKIALENNIPVIQPVNISKAMEQIEKIDFNLMITAAYGQLIPKPMLKLAEYGSFNLHGSLLPKYRGGAPIHHAIMKGEKETGVSLMHMVKEMDAGDYIDQIKVEIKENDTLNTVYESLANKAGKLLIKNLDDIINKTYTNTKQINSLITFGYNIRSKDEYVNFSRPTHKVFNHIRSLDSIPGSYARYKSIKIKLFGAFRELPFDIKEYDSKIPGEVVKLDKTGLYVKTEDGVIGIKTIQKEGKQRMQINEFINGNNLIKIGGVFNE